MAVTGGMRDARMAGATAEITVISVPTTSPTITVRRVTTSPVAGMSKPSAASPALSTKASPIPASMPATDATTPMTRDSPRTAAMTCRRLAPTARSRASSRSRWATMIENVLKMTNDPTNSAMNAKMSKNTPTKLSAWRTVCCPSAVTAWPLTTSILGSWMAAWMRLTS